MDVRKDFPILERKLDKKRLVYLDNAATSQKPKQVIDRISDYYRNHNANIHRGIHKLSEEATEAYENSRYATAKFINAASDEIIFTRNTTESLNILAYWALKTLKRGDEVVLTVMEHHSNMVPWQMLQEKGVKIRFVDINRDGTLKMGDYEKLIGDRTKIVSVTHASNVLGTINDVARITEMAHEADALSIIDAAQSVPHMPVDVRKIGCDFLAFSAHKMLGPTGTGVLYGKHDVLDAIDPFLRGGDMIKEVHLHETKFNDLPWRFEAGTPDIAGVIGLGAAIEYLTKKGMDNVREHEIELTSYAMKELGAIKGLNLFGPSPGKRGGVVSFGINGIHPHDVSSILDTEFIAIRSGHMCAQPLMERLGVPALSRASFYLYNTPADVDRLVSGVEKVKKVFKM
jgi:cysteine desulfurase/selenocysteine lyase